MYKISSCAVPRTTMPSIHRSVFYHTDRIEQPKHIMSKPQRPSDFASLSLVDLGLNGLGRRRTTVLTPPSTPSTPATPSSADLEQQMSICDKSWKSFTQTEGGDPDTSIVRHHSSKPVPSDFHPLDLDAWIAEKLLREVDIDPKMILS